MTFLEGYLTLDLDSPGNLRGIGIFCRFFALKDFLRNRPLKKVWADRPTAVRFRVNGENLEILRSASVHLRIKKLLI